MWRLQSNHLDAAISLVEQVPAYGRVDKPVLKDIGIAVMDNRKALLQIDEPYAVGPLRTGCFRDRNYLESCSAFVKDQGRSCDGRESLGRCL